MLVYSYSFDFLYIDTDIKDLIFNSKLINLNNNLDINWESGGLNIEDLKISVPYIVAGTTKGNLIFIDESTGNIINKIELGSTINKVEIQTENIYCVTKGGKVVFFRLNQD